MGLYSLAKRTVLAASLCFGLPALAVEMPDVEIPYESFTLDNGLTVVVHEDRKAPLVAVSVWYHVGSKDEPAGKTGFAHLFEHLMFNGSENHDAEFFEPLQEVGVTDVNGTTWLDRTNYFETVPTPALERVLFLESDRMGHLLGAVTQEKLDNQRGVVQNEKRQGENEPYGRAFETLQSGIFPVGHPYHHSTIGSMEDLDAASLDDVKEWFNTYYGPNNTVLVLAGDIDVEEARPMVERYFGDIPAGPPLVKGKSSIPELASNVHEVMQDRVPQARIYRVWAVPGRTTEAANTLDVAAEILGGGKTSRLYRDLVYNRQIATNVQVGLFPFELSSLFFIQVDVKDGESVQEVSDRLDAIVADFLAKDPSKAELERAQIGLIAGEVRGLEKVGGFGGKAVTLAEGALYADDPGFYKKRMAYIADASAKSVAQTARTWLGRNHFQLDVIPFGDFAAASEGVDRSTGVPAVDDTPELDFPAVETASLSNGIELVVANRPTVPLVNIAMMFDAGYAADQGKKLGTASLTLAMLDEGTKKRSALDIAEELEGLGAVLRTGSNLDTSTVSMNALKTELKASIDLMADVVRNPAFDQAELDRLRQQRLAGIRQEENQPISIALRQLPPIMYGKDNAYGIPFTGTGTIDAVMSMTREDLQAFHSAWLRPDNATIFVVGDTTLAEIRPVLEKAFGDWKAPSTAKGTKTLNQVSLPDQSQIIIVDRPGSPQSLILAGHLAPPTGVDNNIAITAMNDILGGQFTARVNMNLREEKGWAYGAYTFMQDARGQRPFFVYAPVQTDRTADSMAELVRELNAITGDKPASDTELEMVVRNNVRSLPGQFETARNVLNAMLSNARFGRPLDYEESLKGRYEALGLGDVESAASEVLHPDKLTWMVIGDRAKIEDSIRALDLGEITVKSVGE
ncbi:M16 family metallopeptidase [Iodidimonas gelatinilytica]|nr:pitrilysin family protein [Iodidimonas gelatinilytica]